MHGIDLAAKGRRTFLLSRIAGAVEETAEGFEPPEGQPAEEAREGLRAVFQANRALLELTPDTDAAARLGSRGEPAGDGVVAVHYSDLALFADEVAAFGPEVLVLEPAELVDAVRARLAAVVAAHGGRRTRWLRRSRSASRTGSRSSWRSCRTSSTTTACPSPRPRRTSASPSSASATPSS